MEESMSTAMPTHAASNAEGEFAISTQTDRSWWVPGPPCRPSPVITSTTEIQVSPLAGVGIPKNPENCRSSMLNRASRQVDATTSAMAEAPTGHSGSPVVTGEAAMNTANAGATPKVTRSARLSNCLPSSVPPPSALAANPSSTSKAAPANTSQQAIVSCPWEASRMEAVPQTRFAVVSRSGMRGSPRMMGRSWDKFGAITEATRS